MPRRFRTRVWFVALVGSSALAVGTASAARATGRPDARVVGEFRQQIGHRFTVADGLPSNDVRSIAVADDGAVYAATGAGLVVLQRNESPNQTSTTTASWRAVPGFEGRAIDRIVVAGAIVVIATGGELVGIEPSSGRTQHYGSANAGAPIAALAQAGQWPELLIGDADARVERRSPATDSAATRTGIIENGSGSIRALAASTDRSFLAVADDEGLLLGIGSPADRQEFHFRRLVPRQGPRSWSPNRIVGLAFDGARALWIAAPEGLARYDLATDTFRLYGSEDGLPLAEPMSLAPGGSGDVWIGTVHGLVHLSASGWEVRQGKRWLPDDQVREVVVDSRGWVWSATSGGVGLIELRSLTLSEKARFFEAEIDRYHRRTPYGYVDSVVLAAPGDRAHTTQQDSDNDGLWTSMYGAAQCYAFAATGDPQAAARAKAAYEALRFLSDVTQGGEHPAPPGFVARSILPASGPDPNVGLAERDRERQRTHDRLWKVLEPRWPLSADRQWYWKTDTSSDELDGHYFFYALYFDLVADDAEKARVRDTVVAITDHLLAHDFALVDHDGTPTRWAVFGPQALNFDRDWWGERGLNSLSILSYLQVAEHVSGERRYGDAARRLIDDHGYAANVRVPKLHGGPGTGNQSDDEMAFMSFSSLLRYERDPELAAIWAESFSRYWQLVAGERNPLFHFLYVEYGFDHRYRDAFEDRDLSPTGPWLEDAIDSLVRYPLDRVDWGLINRHRLDIVALPDATGEAPRGHLRDGRVLPIDERFVDHWNHDPWRFDYPGEGRRLADGASFLLPYYLGLHLRLIAPDRDDESVGDPP